MHTFLSFLESSSYITSSILKKKCFVGHCGLCTQKLQQEVRPPTPVQTFSLWVYSHLCFFWFCFILYFFVVAGVVYFFLKFNIHIVERGQQQTDQYILYCSTSPPTIVDNKSWKSFIVVADADDFLFSFASINLHIKLRMYNMLSYILLRGVCANHSCFAPLYLRFIFATFPILYFHLASFSDEREFVKLTENIMLLIQQPIE